MNLGLMISLIAGAPASQQEVMSPPKEDALPVRLAANTGAPAAGPGLPQQLPLEPIQESPQTALQGRPCFRASKGV